MSGNRRRDSVSPTAISTGWTEIHRDELMADWALAVEGDTPFKIEPLKQEAKMIPDVAHFEILTDHRIKVTLSNGKRGIFGVKPYLDRAIFRELRDYNYFKRARMEFGTLTRPNEQDFSPEPIEIKMEKI